jgi:hypothetical protein
MQEFLIVESQCGAGEVCPVSSLPMNLCACLHLLTLSNVEGECLAVFEVKACKSKVEL